VLTRPTDDRGTGLVEIVVAMSVLTVVMAGVMAVIIMMSRATATVGMLSTATAQLRTVIDSTGRQLAEASAVNTPTVVGTDLYLEVRSDAVAAGRAATCVQWRFRSSTRELQSRSWDTLTVSPTAWRTVVANVGNGIGSRPPFSVQPADSVHARPIVTLDVVVTPAGQPSVSLAGAYALRNYQVASPREVCTEVSRS
jgi:type II secretory pathway pseudopilin PulG